MQSPLPVFKARPSAGPQQHRNAGGQGGPVPAAMGEGAHAARPGLRDGLTAPAARFPMRYSILSFDLDGTLVDSAAEIAAAANATLLEFEVPQRPLAQITGLIGRGTRELMLKLLEQTLMERPLRAAQLPVDEVLARFAHHYAATAGSSAAPYPGCRETLTRLRSGGVRLACVTNKEERFAARVLQATGLDDCFELLVGGDSLAHKKPHPSVLAHVLAAGSAAGRRTPRMSATRASTSRPRAAPASPPGPCPGATTAARRSRPRRRSASSTACRRSPPSCWPRTAPRPARADSPAPARVNRNLRTVARRRRPRANTALAQRKPSVRVAPRAARRVSGTSGRAEQMSDEFVRQGELTELSSYPEWAQEMVHSCAETRQRVASHELFHRMRDDALDREQTYAFLVGVWPVIEQFPQYMAQNLLKVQYGRTRGHDLARRYLIRDIRVEQNHADHWINGRWPAASSATTCSTAPCRWRRMRSATGAGTPASATRWPRRWPRPTTPSRA